jgi:hypothetical protein
MNQRVPIALIAGLTLVAIAIGVILARSPTTLAGKSSSANNSELSVTLRNGSKACQSGETLPAETSAIRLSLSTIIGARVSVSVLSGSHVVTRGTHAAGWTGGEVTVPVAPLSHRLSNVTVCFHMTSFNGEVGIDGEHTYPSIAAVGNDGEKLAGRFAVEYVRAGHRSWLSFLPAMAIHMGLGRAASGIWIAFLALTLFLAVIALTSWAILRELG